MAVLLEESFEGTGYEEEGWSETVDANCTVDEDSAGPGSLPAGGGSQCLYIENVGQYWGNLDTEITVGTDIPKYYFRAYVYVARLNEDSRFADTEYQRIIRITGSRAIPIIDIYNDGGTFRWRFGWYNAADYQYYSMIPSVGISTDTWYRLEFLHDKGNGVDTGEIEFRIDGETIGHETGLKLDTDLDKIELGLTPNNASSESELYFDLLKIQDDDWCGAEAGGDPLPMAMNSYRRFRN